MKSGAGMRDGTATSTGSVFFDGVRDWSTARERSKHRCASTPGYGYTIATRTRFRWCAADNTR